jgi:hypothetical protein
MAPRVRNDNPLRTAALINLNIGYGVSEKINLDGKLHKLFDRERWEVSDTEYELLKPSMRLSSNLLEVGLPYITNFLPSSKLYGHQTNDWESDEVKCPQVIPFSDNPSDKEISEAREELENIADSVRWQTNYEMYRDKTFDARGQPLEWMGITRLVDSELPWEPTSYDDILEADEDSQDKCLQRRPLIIGIMGEYVNVLKTSQVGSEEHLRATFMAAITITHEVGHAIFHQDFRALNPPFLQEPWVGEECSAELGFSFISWIFNGYHPQARIEKTVDFSLSLYWDPRYTKADNPRPLYKTRYSIPIEYAEKLLTQKFWNRWTGLRSSNKLAYFSNVRDALKPITCAKSVATARVPNWSYSHTLGEAEWNDGTYNLEGYRKGNKVKGLTQEEIEYARERTKHDGDNMFEGLSKDQVEYRKKFLKQFSSGQFQRNVDDEEENFSHARPPPSAEPQHVSRFIIDDGVLESDLDPPLEGGETPLTRIVVTYLFGTRNLPQVATTSKRARDDDDTNVRGHKRARVGGEAVGGKPGEYKDVAEFLSRVTPQAISNWTRLAAHQYCVDRGLLSYPTIPQEQFWQDGQLDLTRLQDMAIGQRICEFKLQEALRMPLFQNDKQAEIEMKEASLQYIRHWAIEDLKEFCEDQGISTQGTERDMAKRIQEWRKTDIYELTADGAENSLPPNAGKKESQSRKPDHMSHRELVEFCRSHELPEWGTRKALVARAQRYQSDERRLARGESPLQVNIRHGQPERTDASGYETYVFKAILGQSSVTALKSALFIAGNFRPDAELKLFFAPNQSDFLREGRPLSSYKQKDWTKLRLKVSTKWRFGPGSLKENPVDLTGAGKPVFEWPNGPKTRPTQLPVDPLTARAKEIAASAPLTVAERVNRVKARTPALDRLVERATTLGHQQRGSAIDILDEVEDLEEEDERRAQGPVEPSADDDTTSASRATKHSHMADIYERIEHPSKFKHGRPEF